MATVLICGLGDLGGWALEFLVRSPGIHRVVTVRRTPPTGPSRAALASIGGVFQDRHVLCDHRVGDITDVDATAHLIAEVEPDIIFSAATSRSPRGLASAEVDPDTRAVLRRATFGMWLPAHLLPTARLVEAALSAGSEAPIVTAAFPDVVNPAVWKRYGRGPAAGSGNGEVSAAMLEHYLAQRYRVGLDEVKVAVVASHAFFVHGHEVPHHIRAWVDGTDVTGDIDPGRVLAEYPEPIDWRRASTFSVFAASAVKNILNLLGTDLRYAHATAPAGMPGCYPVMMSIDGISLALPPDLTEEEAVAITTAGNAHDGIQDIEDDGTVVFSGQTVAAMAELGYDGARVRFDELEDRVRALNDLYQRITTN